MVQGCPPWDGFFLGGWTREWALGLHLAGQKDTVQGTGASVAPWPTSRRIETHGRWAGTPVESPRACCPLVS